MKLASLKTGGRDGTLIVVNRQLTHYTTVTGLAPTLQCAIEQWQDIAPRLEDIYTELNNIDNNGNVNKATPLDITKLASPLPRAYQWLDGSAYLSHVERVRKARGAAMPPSFLTDPLMYQGGSDIFIGPTDSIYVEDEAWGIDFESEVAVVVDDVPMAIQAEHAEPHIKLIMLVNDVSLRNLIPSELAKGFGFIHGKPPTAFSPVAVTPDELGEMWNKTKLHLPLLSHLNGELFGNPNAGEDMQFGFADLIAHAAKTRPLSAGTIIGSGTVSNNDLQRGCSCLAERRVLEIVELGKAKTPFMQFGDKIRIEMLDQHHQSIFGAIDQDIKPWKP